MMTLTRSLFVTRSSMALCAVLGAGLTMANAQQTATPAASAPQAVNLQAPSAEPLTYSSSSADNQVAMTETNPFDKFLASNGTQPPPRRTYGRPRYRGGNQNADGSNKWAFQVSGGITLPMGNTNHYLTDSYAFSVGGGRNFNKNFGVLLEYDYDRFGYDGHTLGSQANLYNYILGQYGVGGVSGLDGNTHIHSISVNPTYSFGTGEGVGAYFSIGAGFYHKVADFTVPGTGTYCDPYYGYCYQYQANQIIDHYFSNAPGFSAAFGVTHKMGRFTGAKLFAEAKYTYIVTSQRTGITAGTVNSSNYTALNDFPANSNRTSYMPVKVGIRF